MKNFTLKVLAIFILLLFQGIYAQSPNLISYQAIVRGAGNALAANKSIGVKVSILQTSASGTVVYQESFTPNPTTNANGLLTLQIGSGTPITGTLAGINWNTGPYFVKTEIDPNGGTAYSLISTSQLLSVPYALSAKTAQSVAGISGTVNKISKFSPTGTQLGDSQISDDGSAVGIGTNLPSYKLDVVHGGLTGIRNKSTSSYSLIDIDAFNGDAALRFAKNGVRQWNIRNNPANDNLQVFELEGGGERLTIENTTGNVGINMSTPTARLHVGGNFTATGVKAFTIDHPLDPENKILRHFSIESNEVLNIYSGNAKTDANGKATVKLPDYFGTINKDFRYQLTVIGTFAQAIISKKISDNQFEISTNQPNVEVSWEVKGVRNDPYMQNVNTLKAEEAKPANMIGKYIEPKAYKFPENRGINFNSSKSDEGSLSSKTKVSANQKAVQNSGGSLEQPKPKSVQNKAKTTGKESIN
ncbi:hypothetical protein ACK1KB_09615 [Chryseobacterium sp. TY3]|uniref:hypothetical protein n=1 Tax=Soonwooa sp. TaxID=1938592 RepID=UPI0028B21331|nr:hypothetical protein [Soonwooa sp.]